MSISFNLLGGWEPPLTTLGHTWNITTAEPAAGDGGPAEEEGLLRQRLSLARCMEIVRLLLWSLCYHVVARRGHGPLVGCACAMAVVAVIIGAETQMDLSSGPPAAAVPDGSTGAFESGHGEEGEGGLGLTRADFRDPDALLAVAASLQSNTIAPCSRDATRDDGMDDDLPLHMKLRTAAEVLRGGPSRSRWQELEALAEGYAHCGEWTEAALRLGLAVEGRVAVAYKADTDATAVGLGVEVARMRRKYGLAMAHTGDLPAALVQLIFAERNEQADGRETIREMMTLPSYGWYDGDGVLSGGDVSANAGAAAAPAARRNESVVHDRLFPMGFVHDLVGSSGGSGGSKRIAGAVATSDALPNRTAFVTDLAPGTATGAAQPACQEAVQQLCQVDLLLVAPAETTAAPAERYQALLECVAKHREAVESRCLMAGVGRPLLLRGAARLLPAYRQWRTDAALEARHGRQILQTVEQEKAAKRSTPALTMTVAEFLAGYNTSQYYAIATLPPAMRPDADHAAAGLLPVGGLSVGAMIWFSSGGSSSVLHKDVLDNVNCVLAGTKRVSIVPPRLNEAVEAERWDDLRWDVATVREGDCLFIPGNWYHQVATAAGRSIAVNTFSQRPST